MLKRIVSVLCLLVMFHCLAISVFADNEVGKFEVTGDEDSFSITMGGGTDSSGEQVTEYTVLNKYKKTVMSAIAVLCVTDIIAFLVQITKLGAAGDNPQNRAKAIKGILITGISLALLGGFEIFVGYLWPLLAQSTGA